MKVKMLIAASSALFAVSMSNPVSAQTVTASDNIGATYSSNAFNPIATTSRARMASTDRRLDSFQHNHDLDARLYASRDTDPATVLAYNAPASTTRVYR